MERETASRRISRRRQQSGVTLFETALLTSLICLVAVSAVRSLSKWNNDTYCKGVIALKNSQVTTSGQIIGLEQEAYFEESTGLCVWGNPENVDG